MRPTELRCNNILKSCYYSVRKWKQNHSEAFKSPHIGLWLPVPHCKGGCGATCFPETLSFSFSVLTPSVILASLADGQTRIQTEGWRIRRREHPVVHPQGETYIALLLSLFRLPVWSHHTDISSSLAMSSDSTTTTHLSCSKRHKDSPKRMCTFKLALLAGFFLPTAKKPIKLC